MKTPEEMAADYCEPILSDEYAKAIGREDWIDTRCVRVGEGHEMYKAFLAGYKAAETAVTFTRQSREVMRIVFTEDGFDIKIPEDVTMTEAAQEFIRIVMENNRFTAHKGSETK